METELGMVLQEEQAAHPLLPSHVALVPGTERRQAFVARSLAPGIGARYDTQTLTTSALSLLSQECALSKTAFDNIAPEAQRSLATVADAEPTLLAGPCELEDLQAQNEGARQ